MARRIIRIVIIVAISFGLRTYLRQPSSANSVPRNPGEFMPVIAQNAVAYASEHGASLDYSPNSIQRLDALLGDLHASRAAGHLTDDDLNLRALGFGAYIGETLRRSYNGSWKSDSDDAKTGSLAMDVKGNICFPVTWCAKRIINGDEDSVWSKYQTVASSALQQKISR